MIEIWRIGRHKLKGRDLPAELVEHANKSVADWQNIQTQSAPIDDFGVCLQVEQVVQYVERGMQRVGLMRWWIAGDQTLWRLSSTSPIGIEREELRRDLEQIQETFRRSRVRRNFATSDARSSGFDHDHATARRGGDRVVVVVPVFDG